MSRHILLAEDHPDLLDVLSELFGLMAFQVSTASTGLDAINAIGTCIPDILLIDVNMPYVNGLEVLDFLRNIPGGHHTRVFLMTGDPYIKRQPIASLADKILLKPFDLNKLLDEIK